MNSDQISYLDYAMRIVVGSVSDSEREMRERDFAARVKALIFSSFLLSVLGLLTLWLFLKFKLSELSSLASSAVNAAPLFDYGPELSEYRHRHR